MPTQPPSNADYELLHEFRYLIRTFLHFSEQAARTEGLEPQQHQLLLAIRARSGPEGMTIGAIAERLQLRHHSTVELIDRVERRGLVVRSRDEVDRRRVLIRLTEEGEALLAKLASAHIKELQTVAPELLAALSGLLNRQRQPVSVGGAR